MITSSCYWFAVHTKPRLEKIAEVNLQNQQFCTFLPRITLSKRRRGKWLEVVEPLFPRYLFIQANPAEMSLAPVRSTQGVAGLVRFGDKLIPVPDELIHFLKTTVQAATGSSSSRSPFSRGDEVGILDGPFTGFKGIYELEKGKDRALVLLDLLGRQSAVSFKLDHLSHY